MNASNPTPIVPVTHPAAPGVLPPPRPAARYCGPGIGYGSSSGYVKRRGYAPPQTTVRFRIG